MTPDPDEERRDLSEGQTVWLGIIVVVLLAVATYALAQTVDPSPACISPVLDMGEGCHSRRTQ